MTTIAPHLSVEALGDRHREADDVTEKSHVQAIWLLAKGHGKAEVGELLGMSRRWLNKLIARYNRHGPESLGDQRAKNGAEATILTEEVLAAVAQRITTPPDDGGLWTGPKVARYIAETLGRKSIHPQRGWDALKRLGWSIQRPRPRHARAATEEERAEFKKNSMPPLPRSRRATPISRSRSGRRTSTASD
jgi:transposase